MQQKRHSDVRESSPTTSPSVSHDLHMSSAEKPRPRQRSASGVADTCLTSAKIIKPLIPKRAGLPHRYDVCLMNSRGRDLPFSPSSLLSSSLFGRRQKLFALRVRDAHRVLIFRSFPQKGSGFAAENVNLPLCGSVLGATCLRCVPAQCFLVSRYA